LIARELHLIVPGPLEQPTGGYIYDAHMVAGLRELKWNICVHNLDGTFPGGGNGAVESLDGALAGIPDGSLVVLDGLAMGGFPESLVAHRDRLTLVSLLHHPLADETGLSADDQDHFTRLEREALASCAGVIVTSEYTARRLGDFEVGQGRLRVVFPGTEGSRVPARPASTGQPTLLCVASVTPRKGHDVLVRALTQIRDLDWRCVCAGGLDRDSTYVTDVLEQVRETGLSNRIDFIGVCERLALNALYEESTLFVLASHYEGYGMALTEALARGLPVVSTTGGAIPFTVPASTSVLVAPSDHDAFADALRLLLTNESERDRLSLNAVRYADELPDWSQSARSFARAIEELVS
jgi:glycosyltransferase involved in cell wall biosynthesis